ncbi:4820_t:CDS:10, partial [Scutellospora calospora]
MDNIKKEKSFSSSFYKEVIDLTIDSSSESNFSTIELDDLEINIMNIEDIRSIKNTTDDEKLAIRDTQFSAIQIEYLATSNEGWGSNKINCLYLNCCVKKVVRKCTGIKICEYTENEIRNSSHCENPHEKHIFHILNKNQININLLEKLFQGKENIKNQILQTCKTVLSISSRLQYCSKNNTISCHGKIIHLQIYNHPPPPLSKVPTSIQYQFNSLLENTSNEYENIILQKILSRNILKATFGKEFFSEIHSSLNNIDYLRYLINKYQRKKHLYRQELLRMVHVHSEIKEFEVNYYSEQYNQALTFARVFINICNTNTYCKIFKLLFHYIKKLTDQLPTFYHIHNSGWKCIISDLDQGQAK